MIVHLFVAMCVIEVTVGVPSISSAMEASCTQNGVTLWTCMKSKVLSLVDEEMLTNNVTVISDGIRIIKTRDVTGEMLRSSDTDFGALLQNRVISFLSTHAVQFDLPKGPPDIEVEESRGKKNKNKGNKKMGSMLLPFLLGVKAKMALLTAMVGNLIAMIAGKALVVSKIALILGFFLFLKKLITVPPKDVTHETIKHTKISIPVSNEKNDVKQTPWNYSNLASKKYTAALTSLEAQMSAYRNQITPYIPPN